MIQLLRTTSDHPDFKALVQHLDAYLAEVDGDDHAFYDQFNNIDSLKYYFDKRSFNYVLLSANF